MFRYGVKHMTELEARAEMYRAYDLIRQGQKEDASQILLPLVEEFQENAAVWWLMANAAEGVSDEDMLISLENLHNLQPDHEPGRKKLAKMVRRLRSQGSPLINDLSPETLRDLGL